MWPWNQFIKLVIVIHRMKKKQILLKREITIKYEYTRIETSVSYFRICFNLCDRKILFEKKNCQYQIHQWLCARVNRNNTIFFGSRGQPTHSCTVKNFIFVYESDAKRWRTNFVRSAVMREKLLVLYWWTVNWNETDKKKQNKKRMNESCTHFYQLNQTSKRKKSQTSERMDSNPIEQILQFDLYLEMLMCIISISKWMRNRQEHFQGKLAFFSLG